MARYRITISNRDRELMLDLVRRHKIQVFDHGVRKSREGDYIVDALVEEQDILALVTKGFQVLQNEDVDEAGKARQREVGALMVFFGILWRFALKRCSRARSLAGTYFLLHGYPIASTCSAASLETVNRMSDLFARVERFRPFG